MRRLLFFAVAVVLLVFAPRAQAQAPAPSFSVMLWTLHSQGDFTHNLHTVAAAGYHQVELVDEYQHWSEAQWGANLATLHTLGLSVDTITGVHAGFANPDAREQFLTELRAAITTAHRFGSPKIILLSGPVLAGVSAAQQQAASVEALKAAAPLLAAANLTAVIEPIDRIENPTIYLDSVEEAFAITEQVGSPNVQVLYDLYHQQRTHGNLIENLEKHIGEVGLIHIADVPGRHAPGTGEVNYTDVYRALASLGYHGVIAMEFLPLANPVDELRAARESAERSFAHR